MHFEVLQTKCVVDEAGRERNIASAMARGLPLCAPVPAHGRKLAVCGSAPSIGEYLDDLREGTDVWAINGALNYLTGEGIKVSGWVGCDPLDFLSDYLKNPPDHVVYYICSICDPKVFEALKGKDVRLWHMAEGASLKDYSHVPGGTTCITRAAYLGVLLGYRDITIYGADSSFEQTTYVYGEEEFAQPDEIKVSFGGKQYRTNGTLAHQVAQFGAMQEIWPAPYRTKERSTLNFRCGGLAKAFLEAPIQQLHEIADGQHC